jgi:hypothetical protein
MDSARLVQCGNPTCKRLLALCPRCDRGQWYCGPICSAIVRKQRQKEVAYRYRRSPSQGRNALSAESVAHIIEQARRAQGAPPPLEVVLPDDPRVRGLRISPHSLANYDVLTRRESPEVNDHE